MGAVKKSARGVMALGAGIGTFLLVGIAWTFLSGGISGAIASLGVAIPDIALIVIGPLLGLAGAGYAMSEVLE